MEVEPGALSSLDDGCRWSSGLPWTRIILRGIWGDIRWGLGCLEGAFSYRMLVIDIDK